MLLSFLLFFIFILGCLYIHHYLLYKNNNKNKDFFTMLMNMGNNDTTNVSREIKIGNYQDIITATPAMSIITGLNEEDDEDNLSMIDDSSSLISMDTVTGCVDPTQVMSMPSGYDPISTPNDNASHDFSNNQQMRVFQKPDFVKSRMNGRVVVDTNNTREETHSPSFEISSGFGALGSNFSSFGTPLGNNEPVSYMGGVVPYEG